MNPYPAYSLQPPWALTVPFSQDVFSDEHREDTPCSVTELDRNTLFAEFSPLIRRLIRQYGQTLELRQDLPGELYCRFHGLLDSYDPNRGVPLRPYLVRQLSAAAYAFARKRWTENRREAPLVEGMETTFFQTACDPTDDWDTKLIQNELLAVLPRMIAALPVRQRQVMLGRYYEGKSFEEIAQQLGVREASARSLLRHGINQLRQRMNLQ